MPRSIPPISQGLGKFTPDLWDRMREVIAYIEQKRERLDSLIRAVESELIHTRGFPAILLGYQEVSTNRWMYKWVRAVWDNNQSKYVPVTSGEVPVHPLGSWGTVASATDYAFPAWNRVESGNDGALIESGGINIDGEDYPGVAQGDPTFYLQPIQGDWTPDATWDGEPEPEQEWNEGKAVCVWMTVERDSDGKPHYAFDGWNSHDGLCTEG